MSHNKNIIRFPLERRGVECPPDPEPMSHDKVATDIVQNLLEYVVDTLPPEESFTVPNEVFAAYVAEVKAYLDVLHNIELEPNERVTRTLNAHAKFVRHLGSLAQQHPESFRLAIELVASIERPEDVLPEDTSRHVTTNTAPNIEGTTNGMLARLRQFVATVEPPRQSNPDSNQSGKGASTQRSSDGSITFAYNVIEPGALEQHVGSTNNVNNE